MLLKCEALYRYPPRTIFDEAFDLERERDEDDGGYYLFMFSQKTQSHTIAKPYLILFIGSL